MFAAFKRLALVMVMAVLPVQGLAAIVVPVCQQDVTVATAHDHGIHGEHPHDHDAPDQGQPLTIGDSGSHHCSAAFAVPVILTEPAPAATAEGGWFAAAYRSGFIPEQPQRPPLA